MDFELAHLRRPAALIPIVLAVAAVVSFSICCIGGLADALSPAFAVGLLVATTAFTIAATYGGLRLVRGPFRKVRTTVMGYLHDLKAGDAESAQRWLTNHARNVNEPGELAVLREHASSPMTDYRINRIDINADGFEVVAEVVATLSFDDKSNGTLWLRLFPVGDEWKIEFYPV